MDFLMATILKAICAIIIFTITGFVTALTSYRLGDVAVKNQGFLTLNPKKHFEILGFIFFVFLNYGWGNPVKTTPFYYKDKKKGNILTAITPLLSCILVAFISIILQRLVMRTGIYLIYSFFGYLAILSVNFAVVNLIPINPFYGHKILKAVLKPNQAIVFSQYEQIIQMVTLIILISGIMDGFIYEIRIFILTMLELAVNFIL